MKPQMQKLTVTRKPLPVEITDKELRQRSRKLGTVAREIGEADAEFAEVKKEHADRMKPLREERDALIAVMESGKEEREVEVDVYADFEAGTVIEIRRDTKEQIATRAITPAERQMILTPEVAAAARDAGVQ